MIGFNLIKKIINDSFVVPLPDTPSIFSIYTKTTPIEPKQEVVQENDQDKSLIEARETIRRLNRRAQVLEKEKANLENSLLRMREIIEKKELKVNDLESKLLLLAKKLFESNVLLKKTLRALDKWKSLSYLLYTNKVYGEIISRTATEDVAVWVKDDNKEHFKRLQVEVGTVVKCLYQQKNLIFVEYKSGTKRKRGWISPRNIKLACKIDLEKKT